MTSTHMTSVHVTCVRITSACSVQVTDHFNWQVYFLAAVVASVIPQALYKDIMQYLPSAMSSAHRAMGSMMKSEAGHSSFMRRRGKALKREKNKQQLLIVNSLFIVVQA